MKHSFKGHQALRCGFTLVELLVGMGIFSVILVMAAQVTISAGDVSRSSHDMMDQERQSSRVIEQLRRDFSEALDWPNVPPRFEKRAGNDSFGLLVQRAGYGSGEGISDREASVVWYNTDLLGVSRGARGLEFGDKGAAGGLQEGVLRFGPSQTLPIPPGENFQLLSPGGFRMELAFGVEREDAVVLTSSLAAGEEEMLKAVVVSIVFADEEILELLTAAQRTQLSNEFPDSASGGLVAESWNQTVNNLIQARSYRLDLIQSLRIHQRTFFLTK